MPPLTVMIKPASSLCNLRCRYCFYADVASSRETASYGLMSADTLETLMRRAFAYAEGQLSFMFQGGEPTLAGKDFFRRYLSLLKKYNTRRLNVQSAIQTNGYMLDEEWCAIFKEGNFLVGVSVDGTKAIHDAYRVTPEGKPTYDRIAENLALLRAHDIPYNILCVVNEPIASEPAAVFHALKEHVFLQFIPCLDDFSGEKKPYSLNAKTYGRFLIETFDLYEQALYSGKPVSIRTFDNWAAMLLGYPPENCGMSGRCGNYYLIEADGSAYPCDFYVLDEWKVGNILESSFFRMDKSPVGKRFRDESIPLPDACKACRWLALCRGGCKRDREPVIGGVPALNRLCESNRMFFKARYERLQALAAEIRRRQRG